MNNHFIEQLAARGFRCTTQRQHVYNVLKREHSHPTAEEVFFLVRRQMPEISMATVYNCLDILVKAKLVREVNLDKTAMRYCPNMGDHCHFYCEDCDRVYDIDSPRADADFPVPRGYRVSRLEVSIHGSCPKCSSKRGN